MDRIKMIDQTILILDELRRLEPEPVVPSADVEWYQRAMVAEAKLAESRRQVNAMRLQIAGLQASLQRRLVKG